MTFDIRAKRDRRNNQTSIIAKLAAVGEPPRPPTKSRFKPPSAPPRDLSVPTDATVSRYRRRFTTD